MSYLNKCDGGCWFCDDDHDGAQLFWTQEFDAYFHPDCLKKAIRAENPEADIIYDELVRCIGYNGI